MGCHKKGKFKKLFHFSLTHPSQEKQNGLVLLWKLWQRELWFHDCHFPWLFVVAEKHIVLLWCLDDCCDALWKHQTKQDAVWLSRIEWRKQEMWTQTHLQVLSRRAPYRSEKPKCWGQAEAMHVIWVGSGNMTNIWNKTERHQIMLDETWRLFVASPHWLMQRDPPSLGHKLLSGLRLPRLAPLDQNLVAILRLTLIWTMGGHRDVQQFLSGYRGSFCWCGCVFNGSKCRFWLKKTGANLHRPQNRFSWIWTVSITPRKNFTRKHAEDLPKETVSQKDKNSQLKARKTGIWRKQHEKHTNPFFWDIALFSKPVVFFDTKRDHLFFSQFVYLWQWFSKIQKRNPSCIERWAFIRLQSSTCVEN